MNSRRGSNVWASCLPALLSWSKITELKIGELKKREITHIYYIWQMHTIVYKWTQCPCKEAEVVEGGFKGKTFIKERRRHLKEQ